MSNFDARVSKAETQIFPQSKKWLDEFDRLILSASGREDVTRLAEMVIVLSDYELARVYEFYRKQNTYVEADVCSNLCGKTFRQYYTEVAARVGLTFDEWIEIQDEVSMRLKDEPWKNEGVEQRLNDVISCEWHNHEGLAA